MSSNSTERVIRASHRHDNPLANAIRALAMDAVQQANSGHPGAPMGMAEMAVALWNQHLRHNPANPHWADRDRFVLSNGHASMILYALLHLSGYELPLAELKRFRQLHSKTPGHPEYGITVGVETTTGPLGQGLANAVGLALAEKILGDQFNQPEHTIVDHHTYVFMGDGCLMEGISHEACSLAGVLQLHKLICLYDDNGISIDGPVAGWFGDDTAARFRAYGWNVIGPVDGHDVDAVSAAIALAKTETKRPNIILCRTTIGAGSPARAGTAKAHGEPLGADEVQASRAAIGWQHGPFEIPADIASRWDAHASGEQYERTWNERFAAYRAQYPELAAEFERRMAGDPLPATASALGDIVNRFSAAKDSIASRKSSQKVLAELAPLLPELLGGSADLTGSNLTDFPGCGAIRGGQAGGRYVNYGVREFGMAAAMNGIALHGGLIPYGGTFLTFSDYSRNALRMAALMKIRVIHVFTHDSIGVGEDGPTHQPVEHAASLRLIPGLDVWRPCDNAETAAAWAHAVSERQHPSALLLTRQNLVQQPRNDEQIAAIQRGGYVLQEHAGAKAVILATGSEVGLATQAAALLAEQGCPVRVVSIPSSSIFDRQERAYRDAVLGHGLPRIGIEAGVSRWWGQYGCVDALGIDSFGESAPAPEVVKHFSLTVDNLVQRVLGAVAAQHPAGA